MPNRQLDSLFSYCQGLSHLAGKAIRGGEIFAKILTQNDDSGRHGVLVPIEAYDLFPELVIADLKQNVTAHFLAIDGIEGQEQTLAYKYYQRYPERRITCLNSNFNDRQHGHRVGIFLKADHTDGSVGYYADILRENEDSEFHRLCSLLFGDAIHLSEGLFVLLAIDAPALVLDEALNDLLVRFDHISELGYLDSLRSGDTGIGYTFETQLGIKENNDRRADFRGIEVKCKQIKETGGHGGKINLFQQAPRWEEKLSGLERLRLIGQPNEHGHYACHSQVTTTVNNIGLSLDPTATPEQIDLLKGISRFGYWPFGVLEGRLREKHSRAVFVKADVRNTAGRQRFHYKELIYCERPSIQRFNDLVQSKRIVFEFLMSEKEGKVRNHGYPWRLTSEDVLSELFSLRVKLR
ncbi:MAG: MvaI/BcnI family restriction endonuclease [Gallionellaceae bacterium]